MIRRLLVLLVALLAAIWWFRRTRRADAKRGAGPAGAAPADPMVRDRVCNTFLPRSRALLLRENGEEFFFCSEACRDKHSAAKKPA